MGAMTGVVSLLSNCAIFSSASLADSGCNAGIAGVLFKSKCTISFVVLSRWSSILASGIGMKRGIKVTVLELTSLRVVGICILRHQ